MSTLNALVGIEERLAAVAGLSVTRGVPSQITDALPRPLAYVLFDGMGVLQPGRTAGSAVYVGSKPRFTIGILVDYVDDTAAAETTLLNTLDDVRDTFSASATDANGHRYATLGGRVNMTIITDIQSGLGSGLQEIDGIPYRQALIGLEVTIKGASQ